MNWQDLILRLRALTFQKRVERDLEDEVEFHIEMQTRKNLLAGMSEAEGTRRARIQFGGAAQVKEECRDARGVGLIETTWRDMRYAVRGFRRSPTFALTVVATIAVGLVSLRRFSLSSMRSICGQSRYTIHIRCTRFFGWIVPARGMTSVGPSIGNFSGRTLRF